MTLFLKWWTRNIELVVGDPVQEGASWLCSPGLPQVLWLSVLLPGFPSCKKDLSTQASGCSELWPLAFSSASCVPRRQPRTATAAPLILSQSWPSLWSHVEYTIDT